MQKKLIAEGIGTFALTLAVLSSINTDLQLIPTPVIAGLVLGLFVYSIGSVSGCHINPAVTAGLWSIKKIGSKEAVGYILAQLLGALVAYAVVALIYVNVSLGFDSESLTVFFAELFGMMLFTFGIAAVVYGKVSDVASGLVIGGSLLGGILIAVQLGSAGILNPAVGLAVGTVSLSYILGSVVGAVLGMNIYKRFIS